MNKFFSRMKENLIHVGRRITNKYLGEGFDGLYSNIQKVLDNTGNVLIRKKSGEEVRGRFINYEPGSGFHLGTMKEGFVKADELRITVRRQDVDRSYMIS